MRYFLDTEFIEDGKTIDLVSIGIVSEDGRTFYAISNEFDSSKAGSWVQKNVLSKLPHRAQNGGKILNGHSDAWKCRLQIKEDILSFIGEDDPEFWGYYSSYDWVAFCWLFGTMVDLPKHYPMYCLDIKQLMDSMGIEKIPFEPENEHSALSDALWNRKAFDWLSKKARKAPLPA